MIGRGGVLVLLAGLAASLGARALRLLIDFQIAPVVVLWAATCLRTVFAEAR